MIKINYFFYSGSLQLEFTGCKNVIVGSRNFLTATTDTCISQFNILDVLRLTGYLHN